MSLLAAWILGLTVLAPKETGEVISGRFGPAGQLLIAKPQFVWKVRASAPLQISGAKFTIAGKEIPARYDPVRGSVIAAPQEPLARGTYDVVATAVLSSGESFHREWSVTIRPNADADYPATSEAQLQVIRAVNQYRSTIGLPPMRVNLPLSTASQRHAEYLRQNGTTGHYQKPGRPLFFGETPEERYQVFGFAESSYETVHLGSSDPAQAVRSLIDAPYHRIPFMQPGSPEIGAGHVAVNTVLGFSWSNERAVVVSPAERQSGIPTRWTEPERPDPLRLFNAVRPVGYPIVFGYFSPEGTRISVQSASLSRADGTTVEIYINTPVNDSELNNACFLIPRKPLEPNQTYTAQVVATLPNGQAIGKTWQFSTGQP